jgi:hypothetical protein
MEEDQNPPDAVEALLVQEPRTGYLAGLIDYYQQLEEWETKNSALDYARYKRAIEYVIHNSYSDLADNPSVSENLAFSWLMRPDNQATFEVILNREMPDLSDDELRRSINAIREGVEVNLWTLDRYRNEFGNNYNWIESYLYGLVGCLALVGAVPSMIGAIVLGRSPLLRMLGVSIVTTSGKPASRPRAFIRSVALWLLVLGPFWAIVGTPTWEGFRIWRFDGLGNGWPPALTAVASFMAASFAVYMFVARRGLHDRLTRTLLVPD